MRVQFLEDYGQYEDTGEPLYQKGEIAHVLDEFALELEAKGILRFV